VSGIRDQLLSLGWRQGSIIEAGAIEHEALADHAGAVAFLVLNQTCDLVNDSLDKEPVVELLPLSRIAKADTGLLNGRNPRLIHFEVIVGGSACLVEAFAPKVVTLPRDLLLKGNPSNNWSLDEPVLKSLLAWRAARYLRTAFPDAFENRLKPVFKDFRTLVEGIHVHLHSLHIRVEPFGPLDESDSYEVDLLMVIRRSSHDIKETRDKLTAAGAILEKLINSPAGLVCTSCKVRAPHEVTFEEISGYLRWERHDYLSFGEDD
jgi:hypothetical protein